MKIVERLVLPEGSEASPPAERPLGRAKSERTSRNGKIRMHGRGGWVHSKALKFAKVKPVSFIRSDRTTSFTKIVIVKGEVSAG